MYVMADGLTRLMAPILSFTADELWRFLPGRREESVHLALFPARADLLAFVDADLLQRWTRITGLREQVLGQIEPLRKDKQIGSSLQAKAVVSGTAAELSFLHPHLGDLPMIFIVSEVELRPAPDDAEPGLRVAIERASGVKCERCWRYVRSVSSEPAWAGLCERCQEALVELSMVERLAGARRRFEIWVPLLVVVVDQVTKAMVREMLPLHASVPIVAGFLDFTHVRNTGAAFGLLDAVDFPLKSALIALVALGALVAVGIYSAGLAQHQIVARLGLALIIGGAAGNLIDRVIVGSVVDFVDVYWARTISGLQRRRLGHHGRCGNHDYRYARHRSHVSRLLELGPLTVYTYGVLLAAPTCSA